jgi:hypothetical protein
MSAVDRLRQPEYTGENRCIPCTIANVAIAVVAAAAVVAGGAAAGATAAGAAAGGLLLLASLAAIYLRGYLVPGTPTLTKRYFPDRVLAKFDKPEFDEPTGEVPDDVDPEATLLEAGVVEPCERVDDLCLDDGFREAWHDAMSMDEADRRSALAAQLDVAPEELRIDVHGEAFVAYHDGHRVGQWESRAALLADLGAAETLPAWVDEWDRLPVDARSQLLAGLRIFLDECPDCGGAVEAGRETVESCCRSHDVVAAGCDACGARLLEVEYDEAAA